ncbi:hypothetical protein L1787_21535 [Acuticoccus sp. M5D2P5]|uniref:hypothetical protein n=1 Tax=Acuticoccus kalidii TaxID=2910977 RepID=UPI001F197FC1|nr:hypothetical protein [Acuticoccus kalidii]MCF3935976.1 hypothetical protein [Acuticoccus kalidii]
MDAVGFEVICDGPGNLVLRPALFSETALDERPNVRYDVDGEAYTRPASMDVTEREGYWQAASHVSREDPLIDALRRGSALTYDFSPPRRDGDAFTLSLSGSANAIDEVLAQC